MKQLTKEYKFVNESLVMYQTLANALLKRFTHVEIRHLPRIENQEANDLAQMALGTRFQKTKSRSRLKSKTSVVRTTLSLRNC